MGETVDKFIRGGLGTFRLGPWKVTLQTSRHDERGRGSHGITSGFSDRVFSFVGYRKGLLANQMLAAVVTIRSPCQDYLGPVIHQCNDEGEERAFDWVCTPACISAHGLALCKNFSVEVAHPEVGGLYSHEDGNIHSSETRASPANKHLTPNQRRRQTISNVSDSLLTSRVDNRSCQ